MSRRARISTGGLAYHVLNRRVGRLALFTKAADYVAFEKILQEAHERTRIRTGSVLSDDHPRLSAQREHPSGSEAG